MITNILFILKHTYNGSVTVTFYGKKTRPANRTVEFESVTEQTINPPADGDRRSGQPLGYEQVTPERPYRICGLLYKLVYVDGGLESRGCQLEYAQCVPQVCYKGNKTARNIGAERRRLKLRLLRRHSRRLRPWIIRRQIPLDERQVEHLKNGKLQESILDRSVFKVLHRKIKMYYVNLSLGLVISLYI